MLAPSRRRPSMLGLWLAVATASACAAGNTTPSSTRDAGRDRPDAQVSPPDGGVADVGPVDDPCRGVSCPTGRVCRAGTCVLDGSCAGITCTGASEICVPGRGCVPLEVDGDGDGVSVGDGDCDDGDPMVRPMAPERCNAIDDDCDDVADEDDPGGGAMCSTGMAGPCGPGVQRCARGSLACVAATPPGGESCNGMDDDCDGTVDDGNPGGGGACSTGMAGACGDGTERCAGGRIACEASTTPQAESCNSRDDDCDGATDEDDPGGGGSCSTGMPGPCAAGVQRCTRGSLACLPQRMPAPETCNTEDDDCDGTLDDGASIDVIETSFGELAGFHDGCGGWFSRVDACAAAVHRLCAARSRCGPAGGIGPFDPGTGRPTIACFAGAVGMHVTFDELAAAQPPCDGEAVAHLDVCWSAAHRLCQMRGHTTGFGPVEHSTGGADIVCLDRGSVLDVPYTTLEGFDASCSEGNAVSLPCHSAIHRFCAGRMGGGGTGFGAVEHSGGVAYVACVAP